MQVENHLSSISADREFQERIVASLRTLGSPALRSVTVEVRDGTIMLRGEVVSFYAKQVLQHSARRLAGDSRVIDEVRVVTPAAFRDTLRLRQTAGAGVALLWIMLVAGCSRQPTLVKVHPVQGQVLFEGKPAAGATVVFHPKDRTQTFPAPSAKADGQGNFSLTTYSSQDGAPVGEYSVTVELRAVVTKQGELELGPNVLPPQYSCPTTTKVQAHIAEGTNTVPIKILR
jgi:hypothetical protein